MFAKLAPKELHEFFYISIKSTWSNMDIEVRFGLVNPAWATWGSYKDWSCVLQPEEKPSFRKETKYVAEGGIQTPSTLSSLSLQGLQEEGSPSIP